MSAPEGSGGSVTADEGKGRSAGGGSALMPEQALCESAFERRPWADPNAVPYIQIIGVSKHFGDVTAVDRVTLDIYRGELFCLLGGSGCGKSTLLRLLAGFEQADDGRILIDGQDMAGVPPYRRPVNMMFQSYALFPHMTVAGNVGYGLRREGMGRDEIAARVRDMLRLVQLEGVEQRRPHQLSGGQRQRVALARALIKQPKVLLLDEPLGALDKKLREDTQFELVRIQERLGITFVVVTHDQEEAMTLATRIGVMEAGRIVQVDEPRTLYEYPRSRFVADFIGSVNLFEGRVAEDVEDHIRIETTDGSQLSIYVGYGVECAPEQVLWYALRPEKIRLTRERPEGVRNVTTATVEDVAYMGDVSIYRALIGDGFRLSITQPNVTRFTNRPIRWDEQVYVSWDDDAGVVLTA